MSLKALVHGPSRIRRGKLFRAYGRRLELRRTACCRRSRRLLARFPALPLRDDGERDREAALCPDGQPRPQGGRPAAPTYPHGWDAVLGSGDLEICGTLAVWQRSLPAKLRLRTGFGTCDVRDWRSAWRSAPMHARPRFGGERARSCPSTRPWHPGTVLIRTNERRLYYVRRRRHGRALQGRGRPPGKQWYGEAAHRRQIRASPPGRRLRRSSATIRSCPDVIPGGAPNNPMGVRALTLDRDEYAIHGTNRPAPSAPSPPMAASAC